MRRRLTKGVAAGRAGQRTVQIPTIRFLPWSLPDDDLVLLLLPLKLAVGLFSPRPLALCLAFLLHSSRVDQDVHCYCCIFEVVLDVSFAIDLESQSSRSINHITLLDRNTKRRTVHALLSRRYDPVYEFIERFHLIPF